MKNLVKVSVLAAIALIVSIGSFEQAEARTHKQKTRATARRAARRTERRHERREDKRDAAASPDGGGAMAPSAPGEGAGETH